MDGYSSVTWFSFLFVQKKDRQKQHGTQQRATSVVYEFSAQKEDSQEQKVHNHDGGLFVASTKCFSLSWSWSIKLGGRGT